MESNIFELLFNKETIFFGLFLYLFYIQQQDKKSQNIFIQKQQGLLSDLSKSFEKLSNSQEKLTERIEKIEMHIGEDKKHGKDSD